eukprot:358330-Pelagomonas_calceolata.AAC.4
MKYSSLPSFPCQGFPLRKKNLVPILQRAVAPCGTGDSDMRMYQQIHTNVGLGCLTEHKRSLLMHLQQVSLGMPHPPPFPPPLIHSYMNIELPASGPKMPRSGSERPPSQNDCLLALEQCPFNFEAQPVVGSPYVLPAQECHHTADGLLWQGESSAPNPILQSGWLPEVFKSLFRCYFSLPQMVRTAVSCFVARNMHESLCARLRVHASLPELHTLFLHECSQLMLNLHGAPLFCLLLCNAGVSTVLYATVAGRSLLHAGLQACGIQAVCCYAFVCIKHSATRSASQVMKGGRLEGVPKVEQLQAEGAREEDGGTPQKAWQPQQQQQQAEKPVKEGQEVQPSWLQQQQQQWQQHEGPRHNKGQHSEPHSPPICDSAADLCRRPGCRAELAKGIAEALADVYTERDSNAGLRTLLHADSANLMEIGQPQQSDSTDKGRADAMERQQLQVEGSRLPLVEKGQLRQSIRTDKEKAAAAWERQQVPAKQKGDRLAPINLSSAELHTAFPMLGPASPRLHKMTLEALKARAATTSRRYSSLLDQPGRSPSSSTLNCVQKACRVSPLIVTSLTWSKAPPYLHLLNRQAPQHNATSAAQLVVHACVPTGGTQHNVVRVAQFVTHTLHLGGHSGVQNCSVL